MGVNHDVAFRLDSLHFLPRSFFLREGNQICAGSMSQFPPSISLGKIHYSLRFSVMVPSFDTLGQIGHSPALYLPLSRSWYLLVYIVTICF